MRAFFFARELKRYKASRDVVSAANRGKCSSHRKCLSISWLRLSPVTIAGRGIKTRHKQSAFITIRAEVNTY